MMKVAPHHVPLGKVMYWCIDVLAYPLLPRLKRSIASSHCSSQNTKSMAVGNNFLLMFWLTEQL